MRVPASSFMVPLQRMRDPKQGLELTRSLYKAVFEHRMQQQI
jgi:hypothetical protein